MKPIMIVGSGPAGLMAADVAASGGVPVVVVDRMPSLGRKLLMAGRGGLNLTHSEAIEPFLGRYGERRRWLEPLVRAFPPSALLTFAEALGQPTFVGSSGRVFPKAMKASPLLRAWLARLAGQGVRFETRTRLMAVGADLACRLQAADGGSRDLDTSAVVLALGGGSWARLGSDGGWVDMLRGWGVEVAPLQPSNVGASVEWSDHLRRRFAGNPLKRIGIRAGSVAVRGEAVITRDGLEGGALYALTPHLREAIAAHGQARIQIDLRPDMPVDAVAQRLAAGRGKQSTSTWLRKSLSLSPADIGLLNESAGGKLPAEPQAMAALVKGLPLQVAGLQPIDRAISTAGGIRIDELDDSLMLRRRPGVFAAGEMLDWEAPTGGYLLQACFATGRAAGLGALRFAAARSERNLNE